MPFQQICQSNPLEDETGNLTRIEVVQDSTLSSTDDPILQVGKVGSDLVDCSWRIRSGSSEVVLDD